MQPNKVENIVLHTIAHCSAGVGICSAGRIMSVQRIVGYFQSIPRLLISVMKIIIVIIV